MKPVAQLRRENLARLVDKYSQAGVAAKIEKDRNQVYQWLLDPDAKGARGIGGPSARLIERAYSLPDGWLDHEHSTEPLPKSQSGIPDPAILQEAEILVLGKELSQRVAFLPSERARQLAHAYGLVLTHGASMDAAILAAFMGAQNQEQPSGGNEDEHGRRSQRR